MLGMDIKNGPIPTGQTDTTQQQPFTEQIKADLISQGYEGDNLERKAKELQKLIRPAVELLLQEADRLATEDVNDISFHELFENKEN